MKRVQNSFEQKREKMVQTQLMSRGIKTHSVLQAMATVPRENFVLYYDRPRAYCDIPLPILCNQTISQPYIVALMTELLDLPDKTELKLLEIGSGSGYQSAILAAMGHQVYSIERLADVAEFAKKNLATVTFGRNVTIMVADGCCGWPIHAPFDGILVTAASPQIPQDLIDQLAPGATMVIPCGNCFVQQMQQVKKNEDGSVNIIDNIGCRFVPLIGKDGFQR